MERNTKKINGKQLWILDSNSTFFLIILPPADWMLILVRNGYLTLLPGFIEEVHLVLNYYYLPRSIQWVANRHQLWTLFCRLQNSFVYPTHTPHPLPCSKTNEFNKNQFMNFQEPKTVVTLNFFFLLPITQHVNEAKRATTMLDWVVDVYTLQEGENLVEKEKL